ncbi:hypothetical protein BT96DRAFT_981685 [Gymnopus androsaceus JB14]|uniref:Chromo domain-containing protein n=1 Tax=Gymnopus androsaceus JB14 TaxID=1447944 RepID=A0A6A4GLY1_9AGAR|nr:hypothetical protein BT96DRAFT_981685 [Gymnopus androsaceus JB14]
MYEPAKNYTTKLAQPIATQLLSLLTPIPEMSPSSSSTVSTETVHMMHTASPSTSTSSSSMAASTVAMSGPQKQQYCILLPSKLKNPTAGQLVLENEALRKLAVAAGAILDVNYAQMKLRDSENEQLRRKAFAKKKNDEMLEGLAFADHKKGMATMFVELKPKFKGIKKRLAAAEKALKMAKKRAEAAAKAAKRQAEKDARAAVTGRGRGRGCGRGRGQGRGRGIGHGRAQGNGVARRDIHTTADTLFESAAKYFEGLSLVDDSSDSEDSEGLNHHTSKDSANEETVIKMIKGHKWVGKGLQFEVLWDDGDVTWEKQSNIEDCAALDEYLVFHKVADPLLLSKTRFDVFGIETVDTNAELSIQQLDIRGRAKLALKFEYGEANAGMKGSSHAWPSAVLTAISDPSPKNIRRGFISHQKNLGKDSKLKQSQKFIPKTFSPLQRLSWIATSQVFILKPSPSHGMKPALSTRNNVFLDIPAVGIWFGE